MSSTSGILSSASARKLFRATLYGGLIAAVGVLAFYGSSRLALKRTASNSADFHLVQFGDKPPAFNLKRNSGESLTVPMPGRYSIVQYFASESSRTEQAVLYAQYLTRSRPSEQLDYIVVVNPSAKELIANLSQLTIPNIRLVIDNGHHYIEGLHLPTDSDSAIAFDKTGTVCFSSLGLVTADALRVLYVRYSGQVDEQNPDAPMPPYRIGEQIPPFQVRDIRSDRLVSSLSLMSPEQKPIWIFTADCAMCSLPTYLRKLSSASSSNPVPIFSSRVPIPILTSYVHDSGYTGPLYVAAEEIPIFEDLYHNKSLSPYAAIINTTADGHLVKVTIQSPFE